MEETLKDVLEKAKLQKIAMSRNVQLGQTGQSGQFAQSHVE